MLRSAIRRNSGFREVLILVVACRAEIGRIDLQDKACSGGWLRLPRQRFGQRFDIGVFVVVIPIGHEFGQYAGRSGFMNARPVPARAGRGGFFRSVSSGRGRDRRPGRRSTARPAAEPLRVGADRRNRSHNRDGRRCRGVPQLAEALIEHFTWRGAYLGLALLTPVVALPAVGLWIREPRPGEGERGSPTTTAKLPGLTVREVPVYKSGARRLYSWGVPRLGGWCGPGGQKPVQHLARTFVECGIVLSIKHADAVHEDAVHADRLADGARSAARQVVDPARRRNADRRGIEQQQVGLGARARCGRGPGCRRARPDGWSGGGRPRRGRSRRARAPSAPRKCSPKPASHI